MLRNWFRDEEGQGMVEYGLIVGLIAVVVIVALVALGPKIRDMFQIKKEYNFATVSGWVMDELGKVPEEGDIFNYDNLTVTVTKVDFRRAVEIRVVVAPIP